MSQNTSQKQLLVAGIVTILVAAIALINNFLENETIEIWVSIIGMLLVAVTFFWAYLQKQEAWSCIGTYVGVAVAFFIFFVTQITVPDVWIPTMIFTLIALPFFWTWLMNMKRWGFLIPAYILMAIVPIFFMGDNESVQEYLLPAYVMFAVGLPFVVTYFYNRQWGFLIPGGILFLMTILFVGLHYGLETTFLTVGVPVVAIIIGLGLLWRAMLDEGVQQEQ